MQTIIILILLLNAIVQNICFSTSQKLPGRPLLADKPYHCCKNEPYKSQRDVPVVYCYLGSPKIALNIWQTVSALIDLNPDKYDLYEGKDNDEVWSQFEAHRSSWSFNIFNLRGKNIKLNPFNMTCVGIVTHLDYTIQLKITNIDFERVIMFSLGVLLFFLSPILSDNALFYYLTGITIGMSASVLVIFYFVTKLLPLKRPAMWGMMAGGSTLALYLFQTFYENFMLILFKYQEYVVGYLVVSGLISFVVCYRFGPVTNPRSKNLIKWSLQAIALVMIYLSSHLLEAVVAVDVILLSFYNIPVFRWICSFGGLCKRWMFSSKPHPKLITMEEYRTQGERETKHALKDLRQFCNSPECHVWHTVLRLKDPIRFARFVEGKSHLTEEEVEKYEEEAERMMNELLTDDSEED